MPKIAVVLAGTFALLAVVSFVMVRLPWEIDVAIAAAAVIAFAYHFERDDPPRHTSQDSRIS